VSVFKVGTTSAGVRFVPDDEYYPIARHLITQAHRTCLVSMFIIDLKSGQFDRDAKVFQLLKLVREASWRGAAAKVLIGGSRSNLLLAEVAEIARYVSLELGIACRWLTSQDVRGSHAKLVLSDQRILTGSHNWSAEAFTNQTQDSVLIDSPALSAYLASYFESQWRRAEHHA
jgi:phosphatidylserine/phosphatidylglycerophosphate/cardiolipin synthase-like enzyme